MTSRILILLATVAAMIGSSTRTLAADAEKPQYYEVRIYATQSAEQQQRVNDYWQNAAIPAYNHLGIRCV